MKMTMRACAAALAVALTLALAGCMSGGREPLTWSLRDEEVKLPELPKKLEISDGMPTLTVYDVSTKKLEEMDLETYVEGVVAGEMKNDWPMEALKAQAILARTFVLKFCQDKESKYKGADISTDVAEAQAYDAAGVNDRVRRAVEETRGQIMVVNGTIPHAWFHAHSGGMTELPSAALDYKDEDPEYLRPTASEESERAPESVKRWKASFTREQVARACADAGVKVGGVKRVEIGERGESGRARTLLVNEQTVSAPSFRIQIGANVLKSTLIDKIELEGDRVVFSGRGFGHGVGMSQWGAYGMAERGSDAEEIVKHYFPGVDIAELW